MDYHAGYLVERRLSGKSFQFYKPEPVKGKMRFEDFFALAFQDVNIGTFGAAEVVGIEIPSFVEYFGEFQRYLIAFFTLNFQAYPAHHVLSHVEYRFAFQIGRASCRARV